jgi:hypothetical protein
MLSVQSLEQTGRLLLVRKYHNTAFSVPRCFPEARGEGVWQFGWRSHPVEGRRPASPIDSGAIGILWRILKRLLQAFPKAPHPGAAGRRIGRPAGAGIPGRAGRGICGGDGQKCGVEPLGGSRDAAGASTFARERTDRTRLRRVIFKAEVVRHKGREAKDNPRFVITNLQQNPEWIYERGDLENRIKELHHGLEIDRASCSKFWANQFPVLMTDSPPILPRILDLSSARSRCRPNPPDSCPTPAHHRKRLADLGGHSQAARNASDPYHAAPS